MEALELKAEIREITGKRVKWLRWQGLVPAVLYGKDLDPTLLQIEAQAMYKVIREAGTHQLISLQVGQEKPRMTLARDIQRDVIKHDYLHVDFYAVKMDQKVTAQVPLVFEGIAPATIDLGGILTHGLNEIEVECLPSDLIAAIKVNLEGLVDFHISISVTDLVVPSSITILSDPDSMVAKVEAPRLVEEEEEEILEDEELIGAEPEVLTEAKEKPEEG